MTVCLDLASLATLDLAVPSIPNYRISKPLLFIFPIFITFFNLPRLQISVSVTSLIFCIYKKQRGLRFIRSQSHERASLATLDLACGDPRGALARKIQGRSDRGRAWQRAPHPYIHPSKHIYNSELGKLKNSKLVTLTKFASLYIKK